jgi:hypothetical protein
VASGMTDVDEPPFVGCTVEVYKYKNAQDPFGAFLKSRGGESDAYGAWQTTPTEPFTPPTGGWPENTSETNDVALKLLVGGENHHQRSYNVTPDPRPQ